MKYCILSCDNNPEYYSLLPLACFSWQKLGYQPVIIFANVPYQTWQIIMNACPDAKSHIVHPIEGVKDSTLAQLQRLFMGEHAPKPDDIAITADADMVIARDIFTHDVSQGQIVSYGYDLTGRSELPICYVKATAAKWRELMGEFLIPEKAYSERWEDYWSVDQQLLTQRAREYGMERITFVDRGNNGYRGLPTGRWDRFAFEQIPADIIDVHMPRNDWEAQYQVAERLWPGEDHSFITKFREALEGKDIGNVDLNTPSDINTIIERPVQIDIPDKFGFLKGVTGNWNNHLPLLLLSLHLTNDLVIEFGSGEGSTKRLRDYCKEHNRPFESWESNKEWAEKTGANYTSSWDLPSVYRECGLFFCDHAPGEHRIVAIERFANLADIIVIHDTEEGGAGDYKFEKIWHLFTYRLNYNKTGGGAGATAISNKIDLNQFRGLSLGKYTFDND